MAQRATAGAKRTQESAWTSETQVQRFREVPEIGRIRETCPLGPSHPPTTLYSTREGFWAVSSVPDDLPPTLVRFRSALKFTLWTWAAYWPGGGLLLMMGGLDPISIAVTASSLVVFLALMLGGAFRSQLTNTWREFLLEKPIYLLAGLVAFTVVAATIPTAEGLGLAAFATTYLAGIAISIQRLLAHVKATGSGFVRGGADQALIVLAMTALFASFVFWDALVPLLGGPQVPTPAVIVAVGTWVNLLYPVALVLGTRSLREPLSWGRLLRKGTAAKEPKPVRGY